MRIERPRAGTLLLACCAAALTLPASARALNETHVYGIANFGGTNQCGTSDQTHSVHTDTAAAFADEFQALQATGDWDQVDTMNNTNARGSYFTDAAKDSANGDDLHTDKGADEADVVYIHTHGGHSLSGAYSSLEMGNASYSCNVYTDSDMLFGDSAGAGDLEIAVVKACESGDYDVFLAGGYGALKVDDSVFTMWNAFHGDSSCGNFVTRYVEDYAAESVYEGVGENWLDEAYSNSIFTNGDDCPTSIVFGSTSSLRLSMYEHGGWRDKKDTGSKTGSTIHYFGNCNPDNGSKLPN